ncbi:FtsB family cell division protein, partial [Actinocatenispora comari]|uniref:FtsB family cell division protein n=1 Tax=Actinocatenispora comari TaxID=2807577 RepID=UPI001A929DB6
AAARPGARRAGATRTRAPRPGGGRFTGRAVVLALVFVALILAYAYPVRTYLGQRAQIAELTDAQAQQKERIAKLRGQRDKWDDPQYVEAQARRRLRMVRPGDKVYAVYGDPKKPGGGDADDRRVRSDGPWYGKVWSSVQGADR